MQYQPVFFYKLHLESGIFQTLVEYYRLFVNIRECSRLLWKIPEIIIAYVVSIH